LIASELISLSISAFTELFFASKAFLTVLILPLISVSLGSSTSFGALDAGFFDLFFFLSGPETSSISSSFLSSSTDCGC